jgi:hypothetical protein
MKKKLAFVFIFPFVIATLSTTAAANVFEDWLEGVFHSMWEELLRDSISSMFWAISEVLEGALNPSNTGEFSPGGLVTAHPATWSGGSPWQIVQDVSNVAIVPFAMLVLTVVLVTELIQMLTSGNQFENAGIAPFVKWTIKAIVGITLVTNIFPIAAGIFAFGVQAGTLATGTTLGELDLNLSVSSGLGLGQLVVIMLLSILTFLMVCLLMVSIIVALAGRMIDIFMYMSVAPLTAATFMNSEWRNVGNNWLKGIVALAFQAFFVVIAIAVFTGIFNSVVATMNNPSGFGSAIFSMLILFGYTLALTMTVFRSGSISKSIFGAS